MIFNAKKTLDGISINSLGSLTYEEGQFYFDGI